MLLFPTDKTRRNKHTRHCYIDFYIDFFDKNEPLNSAHGNEWDKLNEQFAPNKLDFIRLNEQIDLIKAKQKEVVNGYLPEEEFKELNLSC